MLPRRAHASLERKVTLGIPSRYIPAIYLLEDSMGAISLKLPDDLLEASGECARELRLTRAEYIRRAIERMNYETRARLRAERLAAASRKVRVESMLVNAEFAEIEHDPDA